MLPHIILALIAFLAALTDAASGIYGYDALSNILNRNEGASGSSTITYNSTNRVSSSTVTGLGTRNYTYDARGNTTSVGGQTFAYDPGSRSGVYFNNQPTAVTGTGAAAFAYDGNLKRVKEVRGGKTIYTIYSRVTGGLIFKDEATDSKTTGHCAVAGADVRLVSTGGGATLTPTPAPGRASPICLRSLR